VFALVDCNNFYVSCERLFRPDLHNKPVAVLSNNDGCIISRSNEVKALGIPMGAPVFKYRDTFRQKGVTLFSSNYELYADMSSRVVEVLREMLPDVEVYSIDECFVGLNGFEKHDLLTLGIKIRDTVKRWTGISVGVGIAPTKTLAKVANKQAKMTEGVCVIQNPEYCQIILDQFPIGDLWGVGRRYTQRLANYGILTAGDLIKQPDKWIKQEMTIQGLRLACELRGMSCIPLEYQPEPQKGLAVTRSFSHKLTEWPDIKEALVHHATRAGEKLRHKGLKARHIQVFMHTSRFGKDDYYGNATGLSLTRHTSHTPELIHYATHLGHKIYKNGYRFAKCGIMLNDIVAKAETQRDLLIDESGDKRAEGLMQAMDSINLRMGKHTAFYAGSGIKKSWSMNRNMVSPCYTTRWQEMVKVV